jgi:hypothetical protein
MDAASGEQVKEEILRLLQEGADAVTEALLDVDDATARRRPSAECWSVLECVEHLALTEAGLLSRLKAAEPCEESHQDLAREARFQHLAMDRTRRIEAPPPAMPKHEAETLAAAVEFFREARCETVRFVENFDGEFRWWLTTHPLIKRPVNCYEMLLLMALHPKRHAHQIRETAQAACRNSDQV